MSSPYESAGHRASAGRPRSEDATEEVSDGTGGIRQPIGDAVPVVGHEIAERPCSGGDPGHGPTVRTTGPRAKRPVAVPMTAAPPFAPPTMLSPPAIWSSML